MSTPHATSSSEPLAAALPCLKPRELARRWGVSPGKVLNFIRRGELRAFDVSADPGKRSSFRIPLESVAEFENRRTPTPPRRRGNRRRRQKDYFPD